VGASTEEAAIVEAPAVGTVPVEAAAVEAADPWEDLWRNYHRSINNEGRKNPGLQRKLMPQRYWPYLSEMKPE
jgi:probable DNA metabolism protein